MKTRILGAIGAAIVLSAVVTIAAAAPQISIYLDKQSYQAGDTIEVSLAGGNDGEAMIVDVYFGILTSSARLYTLGCYGWRQGINDGPPWAQDIYVPSGFSMNRTPFFWFDLLCEMPPIRESGEFFFAAGLTVADNDARDFLGDIAVVQFSVFAVPEMDYYVDAGLGDDANDGSENAPWETITHAMDSVEGYEIAPVTIHVAKSEYKYREYSLSMKSWVSLLGEGPGTVLWAGYGSVISCVNVRGLTIDGFEITGGDADGMRAGRLGGGICCENSSPLISNNIIYENYAGQTGMGGGGAGIYCYGGSPTIVGNMIFRNTADPNSIASGGGILCEDSASTIANNLIFENNAHEGGGIAILSRYCIAPPQIYNNTILDNTGRGFGEGGSGIHGYSYFASEIEVVDCIVWGTGGSSLPLLYLRDMSASYCCIEGGYPGEGNIDLDPMLVFDSQWWDRHLYLDPDSPCIDAGSRSAEEAGLSGMTTQEDGTPDTGTVDMGSHYPLSNQH